jgi:hypothetical protein
LNIGIADLDADGHPDLIGTSYGSTSSLEIVWGDGTLSPSGAPYTVNVTPVSTPCALNSGGCGGPCPIPFAIGDVTADGKLDLNVGVMGTAIAVNAGNRTFAQPVTLYQAGGGPVAGMPGEGNNLLTDINGDGRADLVSGSQYGGPTVVLINQPGHFSW